MVICLVALIVFAVCVVLFIWDKFPLASVAILGCTALVLFKVCTVQEAFSGFTSDIVFIIFGTEIFGMAFQESGLNALTVKLIQKYATGKTATAITRKIIIVGGTIAAVLSAFLNNQVVCSLMMVVCINIATQMKEVHVKHITLPIIYLAILGGQCTLIGAPATLAASSVLEKTTGNKMLFFDLLPMGTIIFVIGTLYICTLGCRKGTKMWQKVTTTDQIMLYDNESLQTVDRKKCIVTAVAGGLMLVLFITETFSVGTVSLIGALICIFGGVVKQKQSFAKLDWNILIWLGCSIGMANVLNESGVIQSCCTALQNALSNTPSPYVVLAGLVVITTIISNFVANTTTVIMVLPFALQFAEQFGWNVTPFVIGITMAAGLSVLTPLSCGFIGMTVRVGYQFSDYVKYGLGFQLLLTASVIVLTFLMYQF